MPNRRREKTSLTYCRSSNSYWWNYQRFSAIIITHTHIDHWDDYTAKFIPKYIPIFVQNASDKKLVVNQGFTDVRVVGVNTPFKGITITKTGGQHGTDEMFSDPKLAEFFGESMGFVLKAPGQKSLSLPEILYFMIT